MLTLLGASMPAVGPAAADESGNDVPFDNLFVHQPWIAATKKPSYHYMEDVYSGVLEKIIGIYLSGSFENWPNQDLFLRQFGKKSYRISPCTFRLV